MISNNFKRNFGDWKGKKLILLVVFALILVFSSLLVDARDCSKGCSDLDKDGDVDTTDLSIFASCLGLSGAGGSCDQQEWDMSNYDNDATVDNTNDFFCLSADYGKANYQCCYETGNGCSIVSCCGGWSCSNDHCCPTGYTWNGADCIETCIHAGGYGCAARGGNYPCTAEIAAGNAYCEFTSGSGYYCYDRICTESDNGRNYFTKSGITGFFSGVCTDQNIDTCISSTRITEFYCEYDAASGYDVVKMEYVDCPAGTSCNDGACIESNCYDAVDNDNDGLIDCADSDCYALQCRAGSPEYKCFNNACISAVCIGGGTACADSDGNNFIGVPDFFAFARCYGSTPSSEPGCFGKEPTNNIDFDYNDDSDVDTNDFGCFAEQWQTPENCAIICSSGQWISNGHCCDNGWVWDSGLGRCRESANCAPGIINCIKANGFASCVFGGKVCCSVQYGDTPTNDYIPKANCIRRY